MPRPGKHSLRIRKKSCGIGRTNNADSLVYGDEVAGAINTRTIRSEEKRKMRGFEGLWIFSQSASSIEFFKAHEQKATCIIFITLLFHARLRDFAEMVR